MNRIVTKTGVRAWRPLFTAAMMLSLALVCPTRGRSQAAPEAPAQEMSHIADFPQGDAAWTITIENVAGEKPSGQGKTEVRTVKKFDVVRKGNLRRDIATWSDGTTSQYWVVIDPPIALMEVKDGTIVKMEVSQIGDRQFDEGTFSWVSKSTFTGMKSIRGRKCRAYETDEEVGEGEKRRKYVWVDDRTLRPVAWSDGRVTAFFSFDAAVPAEPLILPEKFGARLEKYKAYVTPVKSFRAMRREQGK